MRWRRPPRIPERPSWKNTAKGLSRSTRERARENDRRLRQALRAIGQGYRVCVIQFMKGRKYGECLAAEKHLPNLTVHLCGLDSFVMRENPSPLDIELARTGFDLAGRRSPPARTTWSSWTSSMWPPTSS